MKAVRLASTLAAASLVLIVAASGSAAFAHCQIPCGIYDDEMRFTQLREHVTTIEKSMNQITTLGGEKSKNYNQVVRWVMNKEQHADELSEIVTYYFMTQRIKPPADSGDADAMKKYTTEVTLLHQMLVHAMKAKQTTDQAHVKHLRDLITQFEKSYHGHSH